MTFLETVLLIWALWPVIALILAPFVGRLLSEHEDAWIERACEDATGQEAPKWLLN